MEIRGHQAHDDIIDEPSVVEQHLREVSPDELSPREALDILYKLKGLMKND